MGRVMTPHFGKVGGGEVEEEGEARPRTTHPHHLHRWGVRWWWGVIGALPLRTFQRTTDPICSPTQHPMCALGPGRSSFVRPKFGKPELAYLDDGRVTQKISINLARNRS